MSSGDSLTVGDKNLNLNKEGAESPQSFQVAESVAAIWFGLTQWRKMQVNCKEIQPGTATEAVEAAGDEQFSDRFSELAGGI